MEAFATVEQLEARWRILDPDEQERACALIEDASTIMAIAMSKADVSYQNADDMWLNAMVIVCCNMVKRAMLTPNDTPAATQLTQSAIGYSESFTFANPNGDMYMTKQEKRMLGIGGGRITSFDVSQIALGD